MGFDMNAFEQMKQEKLAQKGDGPLDPEREFLRENAKHAPPVLAKLFMDLERGSPSADNNILKVNQAVNGGSGVQNNTPVQQHVPQNNQPPAWDSPIEYNEYNEDESDFKMQQRINEAYLKKGLNPNQPVDPSLLVEGHRTPTINPEEYLRKLNESKYQPQAPIYPSQYQPQQQPQYQPQYHQAPKQGITNDPIKDGLLELFSKNLILNVIKSYMDDEEFKKQIVEIVRVNFKKKG